MTDKKFTIKIFDKDTKCIPDVIHIEEISEITDRIASFTISTEPLHQFIVILENIRGFEVTEYKGTLSQQRIADTLNKTKE